MSRAADELPPAAPPLVDAAELRTWVIKDDDQLLVLDKPGWLVCHPSKNGPWSSLAGAVREEFKPDVIRFVYRLDRETSGVIVLAKTEAMGGRLGKAILQGKIGKLYVTILEGELTGPVTVNQPLGPDPTANVTVKSRVVAGRRGCGFAGGRDDFSPAAGAGRFHLGGSRIAHGSQASDQGAR